MNNKNKEELLSSFIDDLNNEEKPRIYEENQELDDEMLQLLETVRAVKRLKKVDIKDFQKPIKKKANNKRFYSSLAKIAALAAVFLLIFTGLDMIDNISNRNEGNITGERLSIFSSDNIVYAMMEAYGRLSNYSGVIEIRSETNGEVDFLETIEVQYVKPNKYKAIHSYDGYSYTQISDGEKLYTINDKEVTIDYSNPEKELWRYHIGNQIQELKLAEEITEAGTQLLLGREAFVYEYKFSDSDNVNRVWVDKETRLPLKKELNLPENRKLINHFVDISINTEIDEGIFAYEPKEGQRVVELNSKTTIDEITKDISITEKLLAELPENIQLMKSVKLKNELYEYLIKYRDDINGEYLDIYLSSQPVSDYHFQGSELSKLGKGWTEMMDNAVNLFKVYIGESNYAKWVTKDYEIMIVSNIKASKLSNILERVAGESKTPITEEEIEEMGIKPTYTKEGH